MVVTEADAQPLDGCVEPAAEVLGLAGGQSRVGDPSSFAHGRVFYPPPP
jgi:hypothetical protein